MSAQRRQLSRQWVPMAAGSCDVRLGEGALEEASRVFRDSVGRPHVCVIVARCDESDGILEELRRQATDAGFSCVMCRVDEPTRSFDMVRVMCDAFDTARVTADDLCCAVGDANLISGASFACGSWSGGVSLLAVPTDETAFLEGVLTPRPLDIGRAESMMSVRACAKHALLDLDVVFGPPSEEPARYARVLMAQAALASSERDFSTLWDRCDDIMSDDREVRRAQLIDTAKARGKLAVSSAVAVRNSLMLGQTFARALASLVPGLAPSELLGEGMRFCSRLSVAQGKLDLDDMLAIDELLEMLAVPQVVAEVDGPSLAKAIWRERSLRSRRHMLELPLTIGRVRLATVENELLEEHANAWCAAHGA